MPGCSTVSYTHPGYGNWVKVDLGTAVALVRKVEPLKQGSLSTYKETYDLLSEMKMCIRDRVICMKSLPSSMVNSISCMSR